MTVQLASGTSWTGDFLEHEEETGLISHTGRRGDGTVDYASDRVLVHF